MNPFVNPKKRSISLPSGCKDLADVLRLPAGRTGDPVLIFIREMLLRAEDVEATEILIPAPMIHDGECIITQRITGTFYHVSTIPAVFRSGVVAQLLRMADLPQGRFPAQGLVTLQLKRRQLRCKIQIESGEADCVLTPFKE